MPLSRTVLATAIVDKMQSYFPEKQRRAQILHIALPIIGGMASQNVLNLVDTAMVGSLGDTSLAAAGLGSFANFMAIAFILGLSTGVQAIASRRMGEGRESEAAVPLDGGLLLAFVLGLPLSVLTIYFAPDIFTLLSNDAAVAEQGSGYLQVRLAAMIGVGMNFSFRGYWSAVKLSKYYLSTLLIMHALNIFLNWVFIFGNLGAPELGLYGAGLATTLSIYIGTLCYFVLGMRHARHAGFLHGLPRWETLVSMMRISIPSGVQQLMFSAGLLLLLWIVGQVGTRELAATHVLLTIMLVGILPSLGFGIAAASLVGHALGAGQVEEARRWGWEVSVLAAVVGLAFGIPAVLLANPILSVFLHDADTLAVATLPLILSGLTMFIDAAGLVLFNSIIGAGDSRRGMIVSVATQWGLFLPAAYIAGPIMGFGLALIWSLQIAYRGLQAGLFGWLWQRGDWAKVNV